ncbi:DUF6395 domain-containing protein [Nocardia vinacea]|uniref:DUF6395 domain-containing protein n=1 Tax=Nocardia vinacea TaxID=96468 RepID=UPI00031C17A6|nr:DUF6395 domain-containing protein [Nocardia vinacea]
MVEEASRIVRSDGRRRVEELTIEYHTVRAEIECDVLIDGKDVGTVGLRFLDEHSPLSQAEAELLTASFGVVLGQMCLARNIRLPFHMSSRLYTPLSSLVGLLYDSHCLTQQISLLAGTLNAPRRDAPAAALQGSPTKCVLLWSGGKDALASLNVLRNNGLSVHGVHFSANFSSISAERMAADDLSSYFAMPLEHVQIEWDLVREIGNLYATHYDRFPLQNTIPHGRDLILMAASAIIARRVGAQFVCAGYEYDLWSKQVHRGTRTVWRHDIQSERGGHLLNELLRAAIGVQFFSPIAGVTEFEILRTLLAHSDIWSHLHSCFWGSWCGMCSKCVRYAITERVFGVRSIPFAVDPLVLPNVALELSLNSINDSDTPFWEELTYGLFELYHKGYFNDAEALRRRETWYIGVKDELYTRLTSVFDDDLAPPGFSYALGML